MGPRIDPDETPKVLESVERRLNKEGLGDIRLAVPDNAVITNDYTDPILRDDEGPSPFNFTTSRACPQSFVVVYLVGAVWGAVAQQTGGLSPCQTGGFYDGWA